MLEALARDCAGAVQLLPEGTGPAGFDQIQARALDDEEIAALLRSVTIAPGPGDAPFDDDFRISLAGAQEKTALLRQQGQWMLPWARRRRRIS